MKFKLLGQFEVVLNNERPIALTRSKVSQLLGLLVVQNGESVGAHTLIDELWGESVPRSALTTLQTYIYHARKLCDAGPGGHSVLVTRPAGYSIEVPGDSIDVVVFEGLANQARAALGRGAAEKAAALLDEAFALWRGPVLAGMITGPVLDVHLAYVNELRLSAQELHIAACTRLGRHQELIPRLRHLVAENPLNESFHAQLIKALYKSGRRAEAIQAYRNLWRILDLELGIEPAPELQSLQHDLMARSSVCPVG
ncbi:MULTISPECIES: AfsR/SARP family transcriptional regulator [unclassified Streptomyces]|uniref:AfsR/SARP family transcriptional regulator n=1 Tax=unclassified Streptomyces TaxID=2593676 RepID=UPI002E18685E|nr:MULTISPECIES: AfsR/SARP family transcriptional regulator [unclassified Streptomyces]